MRWWLLLLVGCGTSQTSRDAFVINTIAEDNYEWSLREPELVRMKLTKMQRDPFGWLRGTAAVYWRDVTDPGVRPTTQFGSDAASRVLLCGDPHPENLGSFLASDGSIFLDWSDFDTSGYGPFEGDLRRLATGLMIATRDPDADVGDFVLDPDFDDELAHRVATGYVSQLVDLSNGIAPAPVTTGSGKLIDKLISKAIQNGDANKELTDDTSVDQNGNRYFQLGDQDPVADDGVIESRLDAPTADERTNVVNALQPYLARMNVGTIVDVARRFGSGVSSYAALRYYVLTSTDVILEVKEERDGLVIHGAPQLQAAEWNSPSIRAVEAQRRLQLRPDADQLLASADVMPLAFRVHDETSYQRGVDSTDLGALYADPTKREQLSDLAEVFGRMLARAHGVALTEDGVPGWTVILPLLGDGAAFGDEVSQFAQADAAQILGDWQSLRDQDVGAMIVPAHGDTP
ncbi:MAG: DUF2252 family protein [Kofleriaceae bacterium]